MGGTPTARLDLPTDLFSLEKERYEVDLCTVRLCRELNILDSSLD